MAILGFSKKFTSVILLLTCIVGSLFIDSLMKSKEGFQEGLVDSKSISRKDIMDIINNNSINAKSKINKITNLTGDFIKNYKVDVYVNQLITIINMQMFEDKDVDKKKVRMIHILYEKKE
jgi:hypothetical protein